MNSPLSYVAPSEVSEVKVYAGITPVSVGGDNLGGTIEMVTVPPVFSREGEPARVAGSMNAFVRTNGREKGGSAKAIWATDRLHLGFSVSAADAENYRAAKAFKPAASGSEIGPLIPGREVASTAYRHVNQDISAAWSLDAHLITLSLGDQHVFFEGYPNQRMDMTDNQNRTVNARYEGEFGWGAVSARLTTQRTRHEMDMGPDRYQYGTGMPMLTRADTDSGEVSAQWELDQWGLDQAGSIKMGADYLRYTLYDWWPPVGGTMGPHAFWNIDNGRRNRWGAFTEWQKPWGASWQTTIGLRADRVEADASAVQGYNNALPGWGNDAAVFNARSHRHVDRNWDLTVQASRQLDDQSSFEWGYGRKSRSPSLYQRYPWSTNAMAALMNNFVGDGNGYVGMEDLRPEVAHTVSVKWQAQFASAWAVTANAYTTYIDDYIDARRCNVGQCSAANVERHDGFVLLQYVNQSARISGMDLSGSALMGRSDAWGAFEFRGLVNLLWGTNLTTREPLYNMMPANAALSVSHKLGPWQSTLEWQGVAGKHRLSAVRNEMRTAGYALVNLKGSREWPRVRVDLGIDNLFDRFYRKPLAGAYVGQGPSMTTNGIPWGQVVPGAGRSIFTALTVRY